MELHYLFDRFIIQDINVICRLIIQRKWSSRQLDESIRTLYIPCRASQMVRWSLHPRSWWAGVTLEMTPAHIRSFLTPLRLCQSRNNIEGGIFTFQIWPSQWRIPWKSMYRAGVSGQRRNQSLFTRAKKAVFKSLAARVWYGPSSFEKSFCSFRVVAP